MSERRESGSPASRPPGGGEADARRPLQEVKPPRQWRSTPSAGPDGDDAAQPSPAHAIPEPPHRGGASEHVVRAPRPPAPAPLEPVPDLPARYGEDRLVLLVRDPWWAYAWWEITDATFSRTRDQAGLGARFVLRVYNITAVDWDGANHRASFDVDVHDPAGNWFLELARPGDSFCAELGLIDDAGRFLAMVRSNAITLPPDRVSPVIDEEWMIPDEDWQRVFEASGAGVTMGVGSGEVLRMMEGRMHLDLSSGGLADSRASGKDDRR